MIRVGSVFREIRSVPADLVSVFPLGPLGQIETCSMVLKTCEAFYDFRPRSSLAEAVVKTGGEWDGAVGRKD